MTVCWTMQTVEAWEEAQSLSYLQGKAELAMYNKEYLWMMEQMKKRLRNYSGEFPVWVWLKKPNMRGIGHFSGGTKCVRLTLDIDDKDILVSDWHNVLNDGFNADNEQEYEDFYAGKLTISKEESWERIFDIHRDRDPEWSGTDVRFQGTTGRVTIDKVKRVEHFVCRQSAAF